MDWQATWVRSSGYGTSDDSPKGDFGEFGLVIFTAVNIRLFKSRCHG